MLLSINESLSINHSERETHSWTMNCFYRIGWIQPRVMSENISYFARAFLRLNAFYKNMFARWTGGNNCVVKDGNRLLRFQLRGVEISVFKSVDWMYNVSLWIDRMQLAIWKRSRRFSLKQRLDVVDASEAWTVENSVRHFSGPSDEFQKICSKTEWNCDSFCFRFSKRRKLWWFDSIKDIL